MRPNNINVYGAVIVTIAIARVHLVRSCDECGLGVRRRPTHRHQPTSAVSPPEASYRPQLQSIAIYYQATSQY